MRTKSEEQSSKPSKLSPFGFNQRKYRSNEFDIRDTPLHECVRRGFKRGYKQKQKLLYLLQTTNFHLWYGMSPI